jgi:hypothetical protein
MHGAAASGRKYIYQVAAAWGLRFTNYRPDLLYLFATSLESKSTIGSHPDFCTLAFAQSLAILRLICVLLH